MIQVAEGALNEVHGILTRLRELSVQSANGTHDSTTRGYLNDEFTALKDELHRIAKATDFNGTQLLNGTKTAFRFWVGAFSVVSTNSITVSLQTAITSAQLPGGSMASPACGSPMSSGTAPCCSSPAGRRSRWSSAMPT